MNLIFRLIRIIIHAFYRQKLHFLDTGIVAFRVLPFDLDINRHMTNSRYLSMMDLGRTDLLIRTGLAQLTWKKKWGSVLGAATIRWRRGLSPFQKFEIHTHVIGWDEKWFYLDQKILTKDHLIAHAIVKAIFVNREGSIPASTLVDLLGKKGEHTPSPELPEAVKHWTASEDAMREDGYAFAKTHFKNEQE
ncbi:MAG TPA: thioesterase [Holosporales bacterium]|nr:thioesterase [Holosporales bacterium]